MRMERISAGVYRTKDKRVEITRRISRQTNHPDEVCWEIVIDGRALSMCELTKREAIEEAERYLAKNTGRS